MPNDPHEHAGMPCPACDFAPFTRNAYWTGKLMLARDFVDEQRYVVEKLRHHNQQLHGWGVVCGLKVVQHPNAACRDRYVCVQPGTAVDCCGHNIIVRETDSIDLWADPEFKKLKDAGDAKPHKLQICIKYRECESEPIPVLYDECGCDDGRCAPNRVLESYKLHVLIDPPATQPPQFPAQCSDLWKTSIDGCPRCDQPDCIVLATINGNYKIGDPIVDASIDNITDRHFLPSTQLLKEVIDCILKQGPGGGGGGQGPQGLPGKGIDAVAATFVPCAQPGSAAIDETGPQRTLKLVIPKGCDGAAGQPGPGLEEKLTQIVALSWKHNTHGNSFAKITRIVTAAQTHASALGLVISFDNEVQVNHPRSPIDPDHVFQIFPRDPVQSSTLYLRKNLPGTVIPVDPDAANPGAFKETTGTGATGNSKHVAFIFQVLFEGKTLDFAEALSALFDEFWVTLRGDFVIDANEKAVDAEHVRAELPSGDRPKASRYGIQGGLFESWLWLNGDNRKGRMDPNNADRASMIRTTSVSAATAAKIVKLRDEKPFTDIQDFRNRVKPTAQEWAQLKSAITVIPPFLKSPEN